MVSSNTIVVSAIPIHLLPLIKELSIQEKIRKDSKCYNDVRNSRSHDEFKKRENNEELKYFSSAPISRRLTLKVYNILHPTDNTPAP